MDEIARKFREHLARFDSFLATFGAVAEKGVSDIAYRMELLGFTIAVHARFVCMEDGCLDQSGADFIHCRGELRRAFGHDLDDAADTRPVIKKVLTNFRCAGTRDHLPDVEVGHVGLHGGAIMSGRDDIFRKLCSYAVMQLRQFGQNSHVPGTR